MRNRRGSQSIAICVGVSTLVLSKACCLTVPLATETWVGANRAPLRGAWREHR